MKIVKNKWKRGVKNNSGIKAGKTVSRKTRLGKWMANGFLLPSILGVLLFFVLPFFIVIYYSVIDNPINAEFVGLNNFRMVFENAAFRTLLRHAVLGQGQVVLPLHLQSAVQGVNEPHAGPGPRANEALLRFVMD